MLQGEVGNVIIGGVEIPPGNTIWDQSRWIHEDQSLRQFVLNEPRGGVFKHINLLVPPKNSKAVQGFYSYGARTHSSNVRLKFDLCFDGSSE